MNLPSLGSGREETAPIAASDDGRREDETGQSRTPADVLLETGLAPEEYILEEIESRGGSLKQQAICHVTGWSDGYVSRTLSEMEDAGTIARVRVGREKIVLLAYSGSAPVAHRPDEGSP